MQSEIEDFFRDKAYAYTRGQLRYVSLLFDYPCDLKMGDDVLHLCTPEELESVFDTYRKALLVKGYGSTRSKVHHVDQTPDGRYYALVTYTNVNRDSQVIGTEHASYFITRTSEALLRIALVEFIDEQSPEMIAQMKEDVEPIMATTGR